MDFIEPARNVVLVAPHGLGKSMIAKNIAHQAISAGHSVTFTTASTLLLDLTLRDSARTLDRRLKYNAGTGLLVIDEVGYIRWPADKANERVVPESENEEAQGTHSRTRTCARS